MTSIRCSGRVIELECRVRADAGQTRCVSPALSEALHQQYQRWPAWSVQLHYDNLAVLCATDPTLGPLPSYATVRRHMKVQGWSRRSAPPRATLGAERAAQRLEQREVRSFEAEYFMSLLHLDFHHGSRKIITPEGQWITPLLLGIIDDHSRLICHAQWYLSETAEVLVHGLSQAFQKHGLPRAVMTDNGAAMQAAEFTQGLHRLGILHEPTLPYSPYQNAKQEKFWATLEGRLMAMLSADADLSLARLNDLTQVWLIQAYHHTVHSELSTTPLKRALDSRSVARPSPETLTLQRAFCQQVARRQRRRDGTFSLEGVRFEVPDRYRAFETLTIAYARWDLGFVELLDPQTQAPLCRLYPLDKRANAEGRRRRRQTPPSAPVPPGDSTPPLLRQLLADYADTGRPPPYLPFEDTDE